MSEFRLLKKSELITSLQNLVMRERRITTELIECIKEVDSRKLYLELGYSSLFSYLTEGFGYAPASAQRRIEAARLLKELPGIKNDLVSGEINLSQISVVSQSVREKKKQQPEVHVSTQMKKEMMDSIKSKDLRETQIMVARSLELKVKNFETAKLQADESVRLSLTISKELGQKLDRAKQVLSHVHCHLNISELLEILTEEFLKKRDLSNPKKQTSLRPKQNAVSQQYKGVPVVREKVSADICEKIGEEVTEVAWQEVLNVNEKVNEKTPAEVTKTVTEELASSKVSTSEMTKSAEPKQDFRPKEICSSTEFSPLITSVRKSQSVVPARIKREVFQRDQCCQYIHQSKKCESKFQLQVDHIQPRWAGGSDQMENLQVLCAAHNQGKYRMESQLQLL